MNERWKRWPDNKDYAVSTHGRIRSHKREIPLMLSLFETPQGYKAVCPSKNGEQQRVAVHRMVARTFIGEIPADAHVCHKNDDPGDNRLENLYIGTAKSNTQDSIRNGGIAKREKHGRSKLTEEDVKMIRESTDHKNQKELARRFGVGQSQISRIRTRKHWS